MYCALKNLKFQDFTMTEDDILNIKNDLNYIIGIINHNLKLIELKRIYYNCQ